MGFKIILKHPEGDKIIAIEDATRAQIVDWINQAGTDKHLREARKRAAHEFLYSSNPWRKTQRKK